MDNIIIELLLELQGGPYLLYEWGFGPKDISFYEIVDFTETQYRIYSAEVKDEKIVSGGVSVYMPMSSSSYTLVNEKEFIEKWKFVKT